MRKNTSVGISPNYVSDWTIEEAIRELVQNMLDAKEEFGVWAGTRYDENQGMAVLKDDGPGLEMRHLVMGISEKSDDSVGQFGEGLKLALLVFAREHRKIEIWSNGKVITPNISYNEEYETEMISLDIDDIDPKFKERTNGTIIKFECSEEELETGKNYFINYYKRATEDFEWIDKDFTSLPGGKIWVNGSMVGEIESAKFSYHLTGEEARNAINRDRGSVDTEKLSNIIVNKFGEMRSLTMMKELFKMAKNQRQSDKDYWEMNISFWSHYINKNNKSLWKRAFTSVMGDAVITSEDSAVDEQAKYQASANIVDLGYKWNEIAKEVGVETAKKSLQRKTKTVEILQKDLDENELNILKKAKNLITKYYNSPGRVKIVKEFVGEPGTTGQYDPSKDEITIHRSQLAGLHECVDTLLHESIHKHSGFSDKTVGFERAYGKVATDLMVELLKNN
jgi:hypothetical protein